MSTLPGTWNIDLKTPIGTLHVRYCFTATPEGLIGSATSPKETVPLSNITSITTEDGQHVSWQQRVTTPMRLNLDFSVLVDGDTMSGYSRAGRLPRTTVTGRRVMS